MIYNQNILMLQKSGIMKKNYPLKPEEFLPGSGKKVWWKCSKCGNEWQVEVRQRVKGLSKCPNCKKQNVSKNNLQTDFDF
ncbi:MAG: zinc-ribbon domain-containing protein [Alphaproteobacteria bacterium]|nr:zinc-ribbon domain-containing protein [Alphaproteobacteria bacterium]